MKRFVAQLLGIIFIAQMVACGGGGGDDGGTNPPPANVAPTANAGSDQTVGKQTTVTLSGSGTDTDGAISSYSWTQIGGASVAITNNSNETTAFESPFVVEDSTLTFQLTVTDNDGATSSDEVDIFVISSSITANISGLGTLMVNNSPCGDICTELIPESRSVIFEIFPDYANIDFKVEGLDCDFSQWQTEWSLQKIIDEGIYSHKLVSIDIDKDGDNDIITSAGLRIYEKIGPAAYAPPLQVIPPNSNPNISVPVLDFNVFDLDGDSDLDIVAIIGANRQLFWIENLGDMFFSERKLFEDEQSELLVEFSLHLKVNDMNDDGQVDIITEKSILFNTTEGRFRKFELPSQLSASGEFAVGDIDGDGDNDIVFTDRDNLWWIENILNFSESANAEKIIEFSTAIELAVGNLDSNLGDEILVTDSGTDKTYIVNYTADGSFEYEIVELPTGARPFIKDVNDDGLSDMLFTDYFREYYIKSFLNVGDGTFVEHDVIFEEGNTIARGLDNTFIDISDVNSDGVLDIISSDPVTNNLGWYEATPKSWICTLSDIRADVEFNIEFGIDTDNDGLFDYEDPDDDNDGVPDSEDAFPLDSSESYDTDGDGVGNNADTDDDNDGIPDAEDAFPLDNSESVDTDNDGIGNNADTDDDDDGVIDQDDYFPLDADLPKINKVVLGPLSDANIFIFSLDNSVTPILELRAENNLSNLEIAGTFNIPFSNFPGATDEGWLENESWYLLTVLEGEDIDANDDGIIDESTVQNLGQFSILISKSNIVNGGIYVTPFSDIAYEIARDKLSTSTVEEVQQILAQFSTELVNDVNLDGLVDYSDITSFNPTTDQALSKLTWDKLLTMYVNKIHDNTIDDRVAIYNLLKSTEHLESGSYTIERSDLGSVSKVERLQVDSAVTYIVANQLTNGSVDISSSIISNNGSFDLQFKLGTPEIMQSNPDTLGGDLRLGVEEVGDQIRVTIPKGLMPSWSLANAKVSTPSGDVQVTVEQDDPVLLYLKLPGDSLHIINQEENKIGSKAITFSRDYWNEKIIEPVDITFQLEYRVANVQTDRRIYGKVTVTEDDGFFNGDRLADLGIDFTTQGLASADKDLVIRIGPQVDGENQWYAIDEDSREYVGGNVMPSELLFFEAQWVDSSPGDFTVEDFFATVFLAADADIKVYAGVHDLDIGEGLPGLTDDYDEDTEKTRDIELRTPKIIITSYTQGPWRTGQDIDVNFVAENFPSNYDLSLYLGYEPGDCGLPNCSLQMSTLSFENFIGVFQWKVNSTSTGGDSFVYDDFNTYGFCLRNAELGVDGQGFCDEIPVEVLPAPDLTVSVIPSRTSLTEGGTINLSSTITNIGDAISDATTFQYYRSSDSIITTDDTLISSDLSVTTLAAGEVVVTSDFTYTPPLGGNYYGACIDAVANEQNLDNSCSAGEYVVVRKPSASLFITVSGLDTTINEEVDFTITKNNGLGEGQTKNVNGTYEYDRKSFVEGDIFRVSVGDSSEGNPCSFDRTSGDFVAGRNDITLTCTDNNPQEATLFITATGFSAEIDDAVVFSVNINNVLVQTTALNADIVMQITGGDPYVDGDSYTVAVTTQPSTRTCSFNSESGSLQSGRNDLYLTCSENGSLEATLFITFTGVASVPTLPLNTSVMIGDFVSGANVSVDGTYEITTDGPIPEGETYSIEFGSEGEDQYCSADVASGTLLAGRNDRYVTCSSP